MNTKITEVTAYKYKDRTFSCLEDIDKFRENEFIEDLENLTWDSGIDKSYARDVLSLFLEHDVTTRKKLKYFLDKVL